MTPRTTEILLATYNGATFLRELLDSLDAQTDQDWALVVRDDGSADATASIVEDWGSAHPGRLRWLDGGARNLGPMGSFGALLAASDSDYFLLCDQDDVWLPEKIARLKRRIRLAEAETGSRTPVLVHGDLIVTDATLHPVAQSFWRYQRMVLPSAEAPWRILALQNVVTGCATIGNAALREAASPIPPEAMMHDWWLALVAASLGEIARDPEPGVLYRQHGANSLGAVSWATRSTLAWIVGEPIGVVRRARRSIAASRRQVRALENRYGERLGADARRYFHEYGNLDRASFLQRKSFPFRHDLWFGDTIRNVGLLILF